MLNEALIAIGAAGGTAVVQAVATDGWNRFKAGLAKVLGRGDQEAEAHAEEALDRTRDELASLEGEALASGRRVEEKRWESRLLLFLDQHPEAAEELESALRTAAPVTQVTINATAHDQAKQAVQGQGTQINHFS